MVNWNHFEQFIVLWMIPYTGVPKGEKDEEKVCNNHYMFDPRPYYGLQCSQRS
jgi:hypothetical protein